MRAHAMLLQSLSKIHKHMEQGPATSNAELQQSERLKTPSDAQKHGPSHRNIGRILPRRGIEIQGKEDLVEEFPQSHPIRR